MSVCERLKEKKREGERGIEIERDIHTERDIFPFLRKIFKDGLTNIKQHKTTPSGKRDLERVCETERGKDPLEKLIYF